MSYQSYADIIIDISHENLDKTYQYAIPKEYESSAIIGAPVVVPFGLGNRTINGYIVGLSNEPKIDIEKIKPITLVIEGAPVIESHLIYLAYWIKESFGGTMNDALKTVMPVKKAVKIKEQRRIVLIRPLEELKQIYEEQLKKNNVARVRILEALLKNGILDYDKTLKGLNISRPVIRWLLDNEIIQIDSKQLYRNPIEEQSVTHTKVTLNSEQKRIVEHIIRDYNEGKRYTYLIHGITGSGKTEVYMDIISEVIASGKQVIVLIPEIALTYQTVKRFYERFGERISILNSRMSDGERYDQSLRAKKGDIDIMIGPRSALFTPFKNLGLIIVDEEHEGSYKSEITPKYHAIEVAKKRAQLTDSFVILGSATPSLESYSRCISGEYKLYTITKRAKEANPPKVWIVDLREELKQKNRSIFSRKLKELIEEKLSNHEQIMLFINRRGYSGFVSCRSCGHVMRCSHCDISLTSHVNSKLLCHYCGYEERMPNTCPACGSKYIAAFGTGTQKVEEIVRREFPEARVLRMDTDTTKNKGGHQRILSAFAKHKADILVGTQMIVKGHDFPLVSLVGIIAADLSLYAGDFRASERTFQLLSQAAGRAGRDAIPGEVVIQTYHPEHYSIITAAEGNYEEFFGQEMLYRRLMQYPPAAHILLALVTSKEEEKVERAVTHVAEALKEYIITNKLSSQIIGPAPAGLAKAKDIYRRVIYIKDEDYDLLVGLKNYLEGYFNYSGQFVGCNLQFDFNPMSTY
ncbi:MAG: primosomal protein N' [Anaerolineaceae bacterium]|nr:MAG: primosomal protein N' [Anaerolineaceae bacterium]